jgi:hypothetical protein
MPVEPEIVKRTGKDGGFKVLHRRWVIERAFSWLRRKSPFGGLLRSSGHDRHRRREALDDSCHAEAADAGDLLIYLQTSA